MPVASGTRLNGAARALEEGARAAPSMSEAGAPCGAPAVPFCSSATSRHPCGAGYSRRWPSRGGGHGRVGLARPLDVLRVLHVSDLHVAVAHLHEDLEQVLASMYFPAQPPWSLRIEQEEHEGRAPWD